MWQRVAWLAVLIWPIGMTLAASVKEQVDPRVRPFELSAVKLLDGPLKNAQEKNRAYLHNLDADRLLHTWRLNAGLPSQAQPLGGWEAPSCEVRGHFLGHYLTACAMMYANTGDEALKVKAAGIVTELAKVQQALASNGYLGAFPVSHIDRCEAQQPVWAPLYCVHKTMTGLLDQYRYCGNTQALQVLESMAAHFKQRTDRFNLQQMDAILDRNEEGGICEVIWDLYAITGNASQRALAEKLERRTFLNKLAVGEDCLTGRHGNSHIPLVLGAARRYELTGDSSYLGMTTFFWDRVVTARTFATGGSTDREAWGPPYQLAQTRSDTNHETCKTYNMLRLTRKLFSWTADPAYADFYERAFWNGILGTQEPNSGMLAYYTPQVTGRKRIYGTPDSTFWCCYGSGVENFAKLADSIFFHDDQTLYVNLFIPARVDWKAKQVSVEQQTRFPEQPRTRLIIHTSQPVALRLALRIPSWIHGPAKATINGEAVSVTAGPSSYAFLERTWRDGDEVTWELPMSLRTEPMPDDPNLVAVCCGPFVLAGIVPGEGPTGPLFSENAIEPQPEVQLLPKFYFLADSPRDLSWLSPVDASPLTFTTAEKQPFRMTFAPLYQVISQRYGLYWPIVPEGSTRHKQLSLENKALSFQRACAGVQSPEAVQELVEQHRQLLADANLTGAHQDLTLALARALKRMGRGDELSRLLRPWTQPFVIRTQAATWAELLEPQAQQYSGVRPYLIDEAAGDGSSLRVELDDRPAIATQLAQGKPYIYFSLPEDSPLRGSGQTALMRIAYYADDKPDRKLCVQYDSLDSTVTGSGTYRATQTIEAPASPGWHYAVIECPEAVFTGRQNMNADFRIYACGSGDITIGDVELSLTDAGRAAAEAVFNPDPELQVDRVDLRDEASEKAHNLRAEASGTGTFMGRRWRHAEAQWSWDLKVLPDAPMTLWYVYWGVDTGRVFEILVDDKPIAEETLDGTRGRRFVNVRFSIPAELTRGKDHVTVTFRRKQVMAGGVFACGTLKPPANTETRSSAP